jgi:hypothetical protein
MSISSFRDRRAGIILTALLLYVMTRVGSVIDGMKGRSILNQLQDQLLANLSTPKEPLGE